MPTRGMNKGGVEAGGYGHGDGVDDIYSGDQRYLVKKKVVFKDVKREDGEKLVLKDSCNYKQRKVSCSDDDDCESSSSPSPSSSIGKNSDLSGNSLENSGDVEQVESPYEQGPLDAMDTLEEVLPIRRGISRFYKGKSKSFASLAEASSVSSIAKPENAYARRCRNLLASKLAWDNARSSHLRGNGGGISKRVTSSSKTALALAVAVAMSNSENRQAQECNSTVPLSMAPSKKFSAWRTFSLADLQHCVSNSK